MSATRKKRRVQPVPHPCRQWPKDRAAKVGLDDVHVSTLPPIVVGPYPAHGYTCPHGVTYWIEPTGEAIAKWVADGTP